MTVSFVVPTITYIVFKLGLVSIPAVAMMMNFLPQPISTFMVNNDFRGIILWAVLFCTDLFDISSVFQGV